MDEREFWRLVAEYLAAQQTSGGQWNPGGDLPYDDYGVDDQIGMGPTEESVDNYGAMDDGAIGGITSVPSMYDTSPSTIGGPPPRVRAYGAAIEPGVSMSPYRSGEIGEVMAQLEYGRNAAPMQGLFGSPNPPAPAPQYAAPQPAAAPTAQPVGIRAPQPNALQSGRQGARQVIQNLSAPRNRQYQAPAAPYVVPPAPRQAPAPVYQAPAQRNTSPARNVVRSVRRGIV